jgi:hypothetical protein
VRVGIVGVYLFLVCGIGGAIAANWKDDSLIDREANLPWAGSLLLQFDVGDADAIIKAMPCK